jgi:uncharacterized protein YjiS (DUF1127 family)
MTYYTQTTAKSGGFRKFSPISALIRAERAYRERRHMLSLSDRLLDDVGLKREELL